MIMEFDGDKLQTNLATNGHKFSIDSNNPAAFKVLMDGLYKFSIRAIIRELSTNAIDASIQAGRDKMDWKIQLPNAATPMFSIEDFGPGISEKDIYDVYCVLFKSTKNKSNDQTGMFGLGSKTPFAYTRQFIITSACNGKKTTYSAGYGEDDIPFVTKVGEIDSNETGLKVAFAVKREDFYKFYEEFSICAVAWPSLPTIIGASEFYDYIRGWKNVDNGEKAFKNTVANYKKNMLPEKSRENFIPISASYCIEMGSVIYAIDGDSLSRDANSVIGHATRNEQHFIIHANIGDVDITPNREELKYSDKTVKFLNERIISTFVVGFGAPSVKDGYTKNEAYFTSPEWDIIKRATNITQEAQDVINAALKVQKTHTSKINKVAAFLDKNSFISLDPWSDWKHKNKPFGKMGVKYNTNTSDLSKRFLTWKRKSTLVFAEYSQKDVDHLNIKENDYIDSAYFVTKIRSWIKDNVEEDKRNNSIFVFSKKGFYDFITKDEYFDDVMNVEDAPNLKIDEFSKVENSYKAAKPTQDDDPCWEIQFSYSLEKEIKNLSSAYLKGINFHAISMNQLNRLLKNPIFKGAVRLYIPRIQSRYQIGPESELRSKIAFKNMNLYSAGFYIPSVIDGVTPAGTKAVIISSTVNNIRKNELWNKKWKPFTQWIEDANKAFLKTQIPAMEAVNLSTPFWMFEKLSDNGKNIIESMPDTSVFKKHYKGYTPVGDDPAPIKAFESYNMSDLKIIDKYCFSSALYAEMSEYQTTRNDVYQRRDSGVDYEAEMEKTYPLYSLLAYRLKPWRASDGWSYTSDARKNELNFLNYIKMVDNQ